MTIPQRFLTVALALLSMAALVLAEPPQSLLEHAQVIHAALADRAVDLQTALPDRLRARLRIGMLREDDPDLIALGERDPEAAAALRAEWLLQSARYTEAGESIAGAARPSDNTLLYRWLLLCDDLPRVDAMSRDALFRDTTDAISLWARGELLFRKVQYDDA